MIAHAMWFFVAALGVLGGLALLTPEAERRIVQKFTHKPSVRLLGFCLLVVGMLFFALADRTGWKIFVQVTGVACFGAGGVNMLLPDTMIILNEAWIDRGNLVHRLIGILYIGLAVLFYFATTPPQTPML